MKYSLLKGGRGRKPATGGNIGGNACFEGKLGRKIVHILRHSALDVVRPLGNTLRKSLVDGEANEIIGECGSYVRNLSIGSAGANNHRHKAESKWQNKTYAMLSLNATQ